MPKTQNGGGRRTAKSSKILSLARDAVTIKEDFAREAKTWWKFDVLQGDLVEVAAEVNIIEEQLKDLRKEKKEWVDKQVKKEKKQSA